MSEIETLLRTPTGTALLSALSDGQRRRVLAALLDADGPVAEAALAAHLAGDEAVAGEAGAPGGVEVSTGTGGPTSATETAADSEGTARGEAPADDPDVQGTRVALRHVALPALADAGLVDWDRTAGTVSIAADLPVDEAVVADVVETEAEGWGSVLECLAVDRRRAALAVLDGADGPTERQALAEAVARREASGTPTGDHVESVLVSLHHAHLPKLRAAGLVETDQATETVTYAGHPALDVTWSAAEPATHTDVTAAATED